MAGHGPPTQRKNAQNEFDLDEDTLDELPKPPDGGWGWVVAFSSFLIHIISKYNLIVDIFEGIW